MSRRTPQQVNCGNAKEVVIGRPTGLDQLAVVAPPTLMDLVTREPQKAFPAIAKDAEACAQLSRVVRALERSTSSGTLTVVGWIWLRTASTSC